MTLDFPSPRYFTFQVFLLPDSSVAEVASLNELDEYPRIAIPGLVLVGPDPMAVLHSIADGINAAGAIPLER